MQQFDKITATIRTRPDHNGRRAKAEALALDGQTHEFLVAWPMEDGDKYPGEFALTPRGESAKCEALAMLGWIASGDVLVMKGISQEPLIHSHIDDGLPDDHRLATEDVHCLTCKALVHCFNNECMRTWVETGSGGYCFPCFAAKYPDGDFLYGVALGTDLKELEQ